MMDFVRYGAGTEAPDAAFDPDLQAVLNDLKQRVTASPKLESYGLEARNAHAKGTASHAAKPKDSG